MNSFVVMLYILLCYNYLYKKNNDAMIFVLRNVSNIKNEWSVVKNSKEYINYFYSRKHLLCRWFQMIEEVLEEILKRVEVRHIRQ